MSDQRIVLFCFAGREANMEVQWPSIARLLDMYPGMTFEAWNLTRNAEDDAYVRGLAGKHPRVMVHNQLQTPNDWPIGCRKRLKRPRWCGCRDCRPSPYGDVWAYYAADETYADAVLMKLDDDVLWLQTETFGDVLDELAEHPDAVVSANVVNNVVCAKHEPELRQILVDRFHPRNQREWFDLHVSPEFATLSHDWLLDNWQQIVKTTPDPTRSMPGERPSINTIAFTHATLKRINAVITHPRFVKMGDEGAVTHNFLPRIVRSFRVAHLQFGPQRVALDESVWQVYRDRYADLAREYLP